VGKSLSAGRLFRRPIDPAEIDARPEPAAGVRAIAPARSHSAPKPSLTFEQEINRKAYRRSCAWTRVCEDG